MYSFKKISLQDFFSFVNLRPHFIATTDAFTVVVIEK